MLPLLNFQPSASLVDGLKLPGTQFLTFHILNFYVLFLQTKPYDFKSKVDIALKQNRLFEVF